MNADKFRGTVSDYMEQLRAHTTVGSNKTFLKYMKDPELMPIGVFLQIMSALNVPKERQHEIFD